MHLWVSLETDDRTGNSGWESEFYWLKSNVLENPTSDKSTTDCQPLDFPAVPATLLPQLVPNKPSGQLESLPDAHRRSNAEPHAGNRVGDKPATGVSVHQQLHQLGAADYAEQDHTEPENQQRPTQQHPEQHQLHFRYRYETPAQNQEQDSAPHFSEFKSKVGFPVLPGKQLRFELQPVLQWTPPHLRQLPVGQRPGLGTTQEHRPRGDRQTDHRRKNYRVSLLQQGHPCKNDF